MRKHKPLIVLLCILAMPMLACSISSTQGDGTNTTSQQVKQYIAMARQDAIKAGISPDLFVRQINLESGFNPDATSPSGAEGIAQFMPETAASLGIDPWNPVAALKGAAQLMAQYSKMFAGAYSKALATYNAGLGTVKHALKVCGEVHWINCLPAETRQYIVVILG